MSVTVPITEVLESAGSSSGSFLRDTANGVRNAVCGIYRESPGLIVRNPSAGFGKGLMDTLCPDNNPVQDGLIPTLPFTGGQCCSTTYAVTTSWENSDTGNSGTFTQNVTGAIGGWSLEAANQFVSVWRLSYTPCNGTTLTVSGRSGSTAQMEKEQHFITNVQPLSGGANNCGDPPSSFPTPSSSYPPSSAPDTVTVPSPNGDGFDITIPIGYVPITPTFDIDPQIKIDVGGIPVTIDFGGFTFDFGNGDDPNTLPLSQLQEGLDAANDKLDDLAGLPDGIGDLGDKLDELKECACPEEEERTFQTVTTGVIDGIAISGLRLNSLYVSLTLPPQKAQFGNGGVTCYFAGWASVSYAGGYRTREAINFIDSSFKVDEGATGFTVTLTNGAKGRVTYQIETTPIGGT
jgi:hypothetical protein